MRFSTVEISDSVYSRRYMNDGHNGLLIDIRDASENKVITYIINFLNI